ncbi:unnamed protein product, partial [Gulo gulo]
QIHCISTVFAPSKAGGEKGVPFCLQIHTFKASDKDLPQAAHLHSAGCLTEVFKVQAGPCPSLSGLSPCLAAGCTPSACHPLLYTPRDGA